MSKTTKDRRSRVRFTPSAQELCFVGQGEGYVMVRFSGEVPFVVSMKEWLDMTPWEERCTCYVYTAIGSPCRAPACVARRNAGWDYE